MLSSPIWIVVYISNILKDIYFTNLPDHLTMKNFKCAWLLWVEPQHKPGSKVRSLKSVIKLVKNHSQLILVQRFLKIIDIICVFADFRPLYQYYFLSRSNEFKNMNQRFYANNRFYGAEVATSPKYT